MIDVLSDDLIEVRKIANETFGNRVAPNTCYRWASRGAGGVRLEAVKIGRKWFTTREAFQDFCNRQTQAATKPDRRQSPRPSAADRRPGRNTPHDVTDDELKACGLK